MNINSEKIWNEEYSVYGIILSKKKNHNKRKHHQGNRLEEFGNKWSDMNKSNNINLLLYPLLSTIPSLFSVWIVSNASNISEFPYKIVQAGSKANPIL